MCKIRLTVRLYAFRTSSSAAAKLDACDLDRSFPSATDPRQPRCASHTRYLTTAKHWRQAIREKKTHTKHSGQTKGGAKLQTGAKPA